MKKPTYFTGLNLSTVLLSLVIMPLIAFGPFSVTERLLLALILTIHNEGRRIEGVITHYLGGE